ncbi:MAG: PD-(D/E)XK nuclease family protein, partial [Candidatus Pacearchaeota archaeon]|nr:PD-(D/E)XK nuclease family protein [Candidatus Pacearchaeota archaeon]
SFLDLLYGHLAEYFEPVDSEGADADQETTEATTEPLLLRRVPLEWRVQRQGDNIEWQTEDTEAIERERIEFSWAGQAARLVGTLTHQYLHQMGEQGSASDGEAWDAKRIASLKPTIEASLSSSGLPSDALEASTQKVINALTNITQSEKAQWILTDHIDAQSEYAISGVINGKIVNKVIDRTFIDEEDTRWIIDYKTSSHEGGNLEGFLDEEQKRYEAQMNEYAQMLGNLDDEPQCIRVGLYFPLMDAWREVYTMGSMCLAGTSFDE